MGARNAATAVPRDAVRAALKAAVDVELEKGLGFSPGPLVELFANSGVPRSTIYRWTADARAKHRYTVGAIARRFRDRLAAQMAARKLRGL